MSGRGNAAIKMAAELLDLPFSPYEADWPKSMPIRLLRRFEEQGNRLRDIAWRVRYMGNCLAELDRECARKDARIAELEASLQECAEDLAIEIAAQYPERGYRPDERRRYVRDMEPVVRARALLEKKP